MIKKFAVLTLILLITSCTNHKSVKLTDPRVYESVEAISKKLDPVLADKFKEEVNKIIVMAEYNHSESKVAIFMRVGKRYEDISLADMILYAKNELVDKEE